MTLPNFLIIGAAKSGTTSLYAYLRQHPQVFMPSRKEPRFFGSDIEKQKFRGPGDDGAEVIDSLSAYRALFECARAVAARGEASPSYLYNVKAAGEIHRLVPEARVIAVLRHPVDRAYSHFLEMVRDEREPLRDFAAAIAAEPKRIRDGWHWSWHYTTMGFYYAQLRRYFDRFDRSQIRVYLHERLSADSLAVVQDIFRFLEVDDTFAPDTSIRHHRSGVPRTRALDTFLADRHPIKDALKPLIPGFVRRSLKEAVMHWNLERPPLPPELRVRLTRAYREDIERLQDLVQLDFSPWMSETANAPDDGNAAYCWKRDARLC